MVGCRNRQADRGFLQRRMGLGEIDSRAEVEQGSAGKAGLMAKAARRQDGLVPDLAADTVASSILLPRRMGVLTATGFSEPEIGHSIDAQYRAGRHAVRFPATGLRLSARLQASPHAVDSTTECVESVA